MLKSFPIASVLKLGAPYIRKCPKQKPTHFHGDSFEGPKFWTSPKKLCSYSVPHRQGRQVANLSEGMKGMKGMRVKVTVIANPLVKLVNMLVYHLFCLVFLAKGPSNQNWCVGRSPFWKPIALLWYTSLCLFPRGTPTSETLPYYLIISKIMVTLSRQINRRCTRSKHLGRQWYC